MLRLIDRVLLAACLGTVLSAGAAQTIGQAGADTPAPQENVSTAATGNLRLAFVAFSRYEGGPPAPQPVTFLPGEQVVMRAKVAGFRAAEVEFQQFRVSLTYEAKATDFRGLEIGKLKKGEVKEPIHKEDKDWLPTIDYTFLIPAMAEYGEVRIQIKLRDEVTQRDATFEETLLVNGKRLPALDSISVINFGFYRRQEDNSPLPAGVYRAGNTIWAKFDLAGFRVEDSNHFHAECDVQVRDGEGKVLFEQPKAIAGDATPEYPQRYLPGIFSLTIQPGTKPGTYSIAVIAKDILAGTTSESTFPFTID